MKEDDISNDAPSHRSRFLPSESDVSRMTSNASSSSWPFTGVPVPAPQASADTNASGHQWVSRDTSQPHTHLGIGNASIFGAATASAYASSSETPQDHPHAVSHRRPLATLQSTPTMKEQQYGETSRPHLSPRLIPRVEKDVDDVTTPPASSRAPLHGRQESTTLTTLSRLFAVQASTSPDHSRQSSYVMPSRYQSAYSRSPVSANTPSLPDHLFARGLLSGRHSDITVNAFGQQYKLHRLILDRAPFFASALSEPWLEANAKEMTVHPEDIDSSITQAAFELALKRLYGASRISEEDQNPVGLFATGCWLEMQDLIDTSIESMLRQMTPETLSPLIKLVTSNYYGRAGDKVLASAKSMLCRDGWKMPFKHWDGIPGDIVREIVGGDGFFIDGEWDRWVLAKRILDRRLRQQALATGLVYPEGSRKPAKVPETAGLEAIRFDSVYRRSSASAGRSVPETLQKWIVPYTHPDVEPILVLLDEGIHYIHLDFEQLQYIRKARDCLGLPVLSDKVVSGALWQQMELRQKVMNAKEAELELGLSVECAEDAALDTNRDTTMSIHESSMAKGKRKADNAEETFEDIDSGSWDGNGKPRKFWIPSSDCNIVMGGNAEPIIATSNNTTLQRHASRLSATIQPEDVQWVADFAAATSQPRIPPSMPTLDPMQPPEPLTVSWTAFPPFRFSAEFPNPRSLKEKKRVYSRTVFYAGSLWNIYIQKVASSRSKQLGVYLHRAKERETEEVVAGTAGLAQGSVDERIGQLEREMIMRSERRERRQRRRTTIGSDGVDGNDIDSGDSAGFDDDHHPLSNERATLSNSRASMMRNLLSRRNHKDMDLLGSYPHAISSSETAVSSGPSSLGGAGAGADVSADANAPTSDPDDEDTKEAEHLAAACSNFHIPTLPPYVDARPTIKTYFKIYSPSRGGRMLSVYESAPDKFNFSQSWGWKSSTLMLDEGFLGGDHDDQDDTGTDGIMNSSEREREGGRRASAGKGDGKLRFSVVIGNT